MDEYFWKDKEIDRLEAEKIILSYHPDGKLFFIKSFKIDWKNLTIEIDPGIADMIRYFICKYGNEVGLKRHRVIREEIFSGQFFDPSKS